MKYCVAWWQGRVCTEQIAKYQKFFTKFKIKFKLVTQVEMKSFSVEEKFMK